MVSFIGQAMVIVDRGAKWEGPAGRIAHWRALDVPAGEISIPERVNAWALDIRRDYLDWTRALGDHLVAGRRIREHLSLADGFSFWWLTPLAEKSPMKSPSVHEVFKLGALARCYRQSPCRGIVLCSRDRRLNRVIGRWCRQMGHPYRWVKTGGRPQAVSLKSVYKHLPHPVQAAIWLARYLWTRYRRLDRRLPAFGQGPQATVVSYFPNIDPDAASQGRLYSHYWQCLHELLDQRPETLNWIFVYSPGRQFDFGQSLALGRKLNAAAGGRSRFVFIDEAVDGRLLLKLAGLFMRVALISWRIGSWRRTCRLGRSSLNFAPIVAHDMAGALRGAYAMETGLQYLLWASLIRRMPPQSWGLYLWENQGWEQGLLHAWQTRQQAPLAGYQHATLPLLDIRSFESPGVFALPYPKRLPTMIAVNGAAARQALLQGGLPPERVRVVEALRYQYLGVADRSVAAKAPQHPPTLLMVTGYMVDETLSMLDLLRRTVAEDPQLAGWRLWIKPHPYLKVEPLLARAAYGLVVTVVKENLAGLWRQADIVYAANSTSATIEAAFGGRPLIVHLDGDQLNLNPLYGMAGATFVAKPEQMRRALKAPRAVPIGDTYFCIDAALPRWRHLLDELGAEDGSAHPLAGGRAPIH